MKLPLPIHLIILIGLNENENRSQTEIRTRTESLNATSTLYKQLQDEIENAGRDERYAKINLFNFLIIYFQLNHKPFSFFFFFLGGTCDSDRIFCDTPPIMYQTDLLKLL